MSGGSYNFLFSKALGSGFLDGLFSEGRTAVESAKKTLAEYTPHETDQRKGRPLTDEERALATKALAELEGLVGILEKLGAHVGYFSEEWTQGRGPSRGAFRDILHDVEWMESGDSGPASVVQRLIEAGRTRRERATLRLVEEPAKVPEPESKAAE